MAAFVASLFQVDLPAMHKQRAAGRHELPGQGHVSLLFGRVAGYPRIFSNCEKKLRKMCVSTWLHCSTVVTKSSKSYRMTEKVSIFLRTLFSFGM